MPILLHPSSGLIICIMPEGMGSAVQVTPGFIGVFVPMNVLQYGNAACAVTIATDAPADFANAFKTGSAFKSSSAKGRMSPGMER
jgi:hypothetical protein